MVDWVHGNTTCLWPVVALDSELVLSAGSLCYFISLRFLEISGRVSRTHERLVGTSTTGNDTDHSTDAAGDNLLGTGWELDTGLALIWVVSDDGNVVSGGTSESTTVTDLLLDVGDDGSLWNLADWKNVADGQGGVLSGVDELASVHALVGDESLGVKLESVWVTENDLGERSTTSWVVDDVLDNTADVSMALSVVEVTERSWGNTKPLVGSEDAIIRYP